MQAESTQIDSQVDDQNHDQGIDMDDKKRAARSEQRQMSSDGDTKEGKKEDKKKGSGMKKYPPTPEELREWMDRKGLSNKDVAKALRLSDGRVVRFWTSKKDPRPIPYPSWYTLRHKFGK